MRIQFFKTDLSRAALLAMLTMLSTAAGAASASSSDVQVTQAWIRPTVKGQMGTGGFMTLTSTKGAKLLGFSTPLAQSSQLHEMSMQADVMQMREVSELVLPAGKAVSLKPGGHHLMIMGLKKILRTGDQVPLQIKVQEADGRTVQLAVKVPVRSGPP